MPRQRVTDSACAGGHSRCSPGRNWRQVGIPPTSRAATSPRSNRSCSTAAALQPVSVESQRSLTPALDAGCALAVALGVNPATVTTAPGPATGKELASVQSAPLMERLRQMRVGVGQRDGRGIAREVAGQTQRPRSFAGAVEAVTDRLSQAGVNMTGARLVWLRAGCRCFDSAHGDHPRRSSSARPPAPDRLACCGRCWICCCPSPAAAAPRPTGSLTGRPPAAVRQGWRAPKTGSAGRHQRAGRRASPTGPAGF